MDRKVYTIEEIEAYCRELMPLEDRLQLKQQLEVDETLREQVQAFQPIFAGFSALQDIRFAKQMTQWEEEGRGTDDMELAEWYLQGELGERATQAVEQRQKGDPGFEKKIESQKVLLDSFAAAQSEAFSQKMQQWEPKETTPLKVKSRSPWIRRLSIAASFLVLAAVGLNWYISSQYSNQALFAAFYQSPNVGGTMGGATNSEFQVAFAAAHRLLQAKDFPAANTAFQQIKQQLETTSFDPLAQQYYTDNVAWSGLLAQLGLGQTDASFYTELDRIAGNSQHEYQEQAIALRSKLNSIFY